MSVPNTTILLLVVQSKQKHLYFRFFWYILITYIVATFSLLTSGDTIVLKEASATLLFMNFPYLQNAKVIEAS